MGISINAKSFIKLIMDLSLPNQVQRLFQFQVILAYYFLRRIYNQKMKQESNTTIVYSTKIKEQSQTIAPNPNIQQKINEQNEDFMLKDARHFEPISEQDHSDDEAMMAEQKANRKAILKENHLLKASHKMVVGTGFSMDITEFFHFQSKKSPFSQGHSILQDITGSRWAWILLLYCLTTGAIMPGWIMNIKANKILRISWRFFMQVFMVLPFVFYQYRNCDEQTKKKYSLKYVFDRHNMIKPLMSGVATSLWFTAIVFGFEWTSVSHSIVMGSLSNFFLSLGRSWRRQSHDFESGGQMFVILGVILVISDTIKFSPSFLNESDFTVNNTFYYNRPLIERLTFDLTSFTMSYFMAQFSKFTSDLKSYFPPFFSMLIVNIYVCIFMCFSSVFVHGCTFDFDSYWGIWSLFSSQHFAGFMFMAIILSLGQLFSVFWITKMFPQPIIPALVMTLQPFLASLIIDLADVQRIPGKYTFVGYLLMVPGLAFILVGQCLFQKGSKTRIEEQKRSLQLISELKKVDATIEHHQKRKKSRLQQRKTRVFRDFRRNDSNSDSSSFV